MFNGKIPSAAVEAGGGRFGKVAGGWARSEGEATL